MDVSDYPDDRFYDMNNQIWYEPLADGTVRAGFTLWAAALMGEILVFTPNRLLKKSTTKPMMSNIRIQKVWQRRFFLRVTYDA